MKSCLELFEEAAPSHFRGLSANVKSLKPRGDRSRCYDRDWCPEYMCDILQDTKAA